MTLSNNQISQSHNLKHKIFLSINYILIGAASSCIFLTLSLRLFPSLPGFTLILLHVFTIAISVFACSLSGGSHKQYAAHMVCTVLTIIFQGSVSVLIFTRPADFLGGLKSYVREEDGVVILKLGGGLCVVIFGLEFVVLGLAFVLRYYEFVDGDLGRGNSSNGSKGGEDLKNWYSPFQV